MHVQSVRLRAVECTLQSVRRNLPHMILHRHAMCQQYDLLSNLIMLLYDYHHQQLVL